MIAPSSTSDLLELVRKSGIVREELFDTHLRQYPDLPTDAVQSAATLVKSGLLTRFQAKLLLTGRYRGFKLGPYIVKEQIGQGGMGAVYLAEHETLRRLVALKVLTQPKKDANAKLTIERFQREARAAAALDHPNIVRMHDVGRHADIHFLAMEYVEGQTLEQILTSGGPITPSRAVEYIAQAAAGLQHAFEKGFIHRDIKPSNLMLAKDGTIKILDMGLARSFTDDTDKLTEILDKGAVVGTADFISPEQAINAPNIDIRSDIYNLGATLFTLITGKSPFSGNTTQKLLQHQLKDAPSLMTIDRTLPSGLAEVVGKMLQKKPERRYQTPAEVISALANWLPEHGAGRVMVGLSSTDLGSSGKLQNTLNEIAASGTRRLSGTRIAGDKKKPWALWGSAAAIVLAAIGVVAYAVIPSSTPNKNNATISATNTPVVPSKPVGTASTPLPKAPPITEPIAATVPDAKPLRKQEAQTVLEPDFTKYSLFRERGKLVPDSNNPTNHVWATTLKTGIVPLQWSGRTYRHRSEGEWLVEKIDDEPAIGFRTASGEGSMMLFAPHFDTTSGKCHLELTYRTETGNEAVELRFKPQRPQSFDAWDISKLPSTNGRWVSTMFDIDLKGTKGGFFELHNSNAKFLWAWVKNLTVTEIAVGPESPVIADGPVVSSFDFSTMKPGKFPFADAKFKDDIAPSLPTGSIANCWKATSVAEFQVGEIDGKTGLGITNLNDDLSAQIHVKDLGDLIAKKTYRVRVEYATANEAIGKMQVRVVGGTYPVVNGIDLTSTGAKWKTATFDFVQQGVPLDLQISNAIIGEGNRLTIRKIEILETKPNIAAETGKVVYSADFGAMKPGKFPFASSKFADDNPPKLPAGVTAYCWKSEWVAEFSVDRVDGQTGFGSTNLNNDCNAEITVFLGDLLTPGKNCLVRVEYLTQNDASGKIDIRMPKDNYVELGGVELASTSGKWKTVSFEFIAPAAGTILDLRSNNRVIGEGNRLMLRKIELLETK